MMGDMFVDCKLLPEKLLCQTGSQHSLRYLEKALVGGIMSMSQNYVQIRGIHLCKYLKTLEHP